MTDFHEIPLTFGADRHLFGTLTLPIGVTPSPVALLLTNAGVIHRIGPHRINVKIARHLARQGVATLRFDLAGQGDSRSAASGGDYAQQAVADIRAAMDHVSRATDLKQFAIAGICSGADNAWATAQVDPRVVALCLIDGATYETPRTARVRLQRRLGNGGIARAVVNSLRRKSAALFTRLRTGGSPETIAGGLNRPQPSRDTYATTMQQLVDRGVDVRLVFSGSLLTQYNHPSQFADAFAGHAFVPRVRADYRPDIDHTVTPIAAQRALLALVSDWLKVDATR